MTAIPQLPGTISGPRDRGYDSGVYATLRLPFLAADNQSARILPL